MKLIAGVFVALLIVLWGGVMVIGNTPDAGVDTPGKGGDTARTTGSVPAQARAKMSPAVEHNASPANMSPPVQQNASPADSPSTPQNNSAAGDAFAAHIQMLTPEERRNKQFAREEEAKRQAEQEAKAEAYTKQDKGGERFGQHVAARPTVTPAGNTQ